MSRCGIASFWISVGLEISRDLSRCKHITGLIPRDVNSPSLFLGSGAFVARGEAVLLSLGANVDAGEVISGLPVNKEEEAKVRGMTGVAFDEETGVLRFLFNVRDATDAEADDEILSLTDFDDFSAPVSARAVEINGSD